MESIPSQGKGLFITDLTSQGYEIIKCKLRGIKKKVTIEQVEYNLEANEIPQWLSKYGTFKANLTGKLHPNCNPEYDPSSSGIYTIKMKLWGSILQHLPMCGRKINST